MLLLLLVRSNKAAIKILLGSLLQLLLLLPRCILHPFMLRPPLLLLLLSTPRAMTIMLIPYLLPLVQLLLLALL